MACSMDGKQTKACCAPAAKHAEELVPPATATVVPQMDEASLESMMSLAGGTFFDGDG